MDNDQMFEEQSYQSAFKEEEIEIDIPEHPVIVGSAQLKGLMDKADANQTYFALPRAHLRSGIDLGENEVQPESYAQMDFSEAIMPFLVAGEIDMRRTKWDNANIQCAQFNGTYLHEASFADTEALGISAIAAEMQKSRLAGATFTGSNFTQAQMQECRIDSTNLTQATLSGADLTKAQMNWGSLRLALATETNFTEASLIAVDAKKASFIQCDFTDASLAHTDLTNALLKDCILEGTDMTLTNLSGVRVGKGSGKDLVKDSEKIYEQLSHANWQNIRRALFLVLMKIPAERMNDITPRLRAGILPTEPLWKAWGLPKPEPKETIEEQRARHDPLLVLEMFLGAFHDVDDPNYNKLPFMMLINKWLNKLNEFAIDVTKNTH